MEIQKVGLIGVGNMGSMMSLFLAEHGFEVSIHDISWKNMHKTLKKAQAASLDARIYMHNDYESLANSLGSPKVILLSVPQGSTGDTILQALNPYLTKGDIIIDGSNENYLVTQRRQGQLQCQGVHYVGMGISGGYQGARYGPSLSPSGEDSALDQILPLLCKIAAKDGQDRPCVTKIGPGGSGHYVKMVHNGIEHGMMSVISEVWGIMSDAMNMSGEEIGAVFKQWASEGELENNFLVAISAPICCAKDPSDGSYVLPTIKDNVVQDADGSEGTGVWANLEAIRHHVPTPSMTSAHQFRLASADVRQRQRVKETMLGGFPVGCIHQDEKQKQNFLEDLRKSVYGAFLALFAQGLNLLAKANDDAKWGIDFLSVIRIWRAGCIIRSDYLSDLFERLYSDSLVKNPLFAKMVTDELRKCYSSLKNVVIKGVGANSPVPTLGATLEYLKYCGSTDLPLSFMEAQMDYFGAHGFDLKADSSVEIKKGGHHFDWPPM